ncbi:MAG: L-seryl-tRNA(Sec) selenium transferase [Thermodesulfobacteriota bacterium]
MRERLLRELPSVDALLRDERLRSRSSQWSQELVLWAARRVLKDLREGILAGTLAEVDSAALPGLVTGEIESALCPRLKRVVNASGTVIHTNIGRAVLAPEAAAAALEAAGNCNLEFDLAGGARGERDSLVEGLLCELTGAEAACVVNNNAAAVLLTLNTLAEGKEAVISRGELIEIGGSFRLPEIIEKSGCLLREVGTTNRTHARDYAGAMTPATGVIFKAHTSNYRVTGFTAEVALPELVSIGRAHGVPVVEDLGSGSLVDLAPYGLPGEPTVREVVEAGADAVTFSGDKLLGGPQAGLVVGSRDVVDSLKANPLKRALRAGKLTLAALEATLRLYLDPGRLARRLPVLRHLARGPGEIDAAARAAAALLTERLGAEYKVEVEDSVSVVGGGALPGVELATRVVAITHSTLGADDIFAIFLAADPPVLGRVNKDRFLLDMRTIDEPASVAPGAPGAPGRPGR